MEAQYFVYTRGFDIANDYKLMFSPSVDFCPDEVRKHFLKQARGVINIEQYQGSLDSPRWLFSRFHGYSLWGMGIMNSKLCETANIDYTGRAVRGFFGFVIKNNTFTELPFDISFWKKFYLTHVSPLWEVSKENFKQKGIFVEVAFEHYHCIRPNIIEHQLNIQLNKTVIWANLQEKDMFSTAMAITSDISCVSGLSERAHAYNHDYCYFNAIVDGITETESRIYSGNEEDDASDLITTDEKPKKDYRPMMIIAVTAAVIMLLTIVLFLKKNRSSAPSSLGGIEMKKEEGMKRDKNVASDTIIERVLREDEK